jgi:hypothetical protein
MDTPEPEVERFFRAFERASDAGDIPALLPQFAETFMVIGPEGALCVRAEDFAKALPKRKQFFDELGCESTSLVELNPIRLNSRYVLAKTRWRMRFVQGGTAKDVSADSLFVVDTADEAMRIVFYLPSRDHTTMLREQGILPV